MKRILSLLAVACLLLCLLCGCGDSGSSTTDDGEKKEKVTTSVSGDVTTTSGESGSTTTTDDTTTADGTTTTTASQVWDGTAYNGEWATRDFSWEYGGGQHLVLDINSATLRIEYTEVFSSKLVSAELVLPVSKVKDNAVSGEFNDSFGNTGTLTLTFEGDKVVCEVSDVEEDDMNLGYSLNEGEYILRPYEEEPAEVTYLYLVIGPFGDPVYCIDPEDLSTACSDPSEYSPYEVIDVTDEYNYYEEEGDDPAIHVPAGLFGTYYDSWGNYTELRIEKGGMNEDLVVLYAYLISGDYELYVTECWDDNIAYYAEGESLWDGSACSAELQYDSNDGYVVMTLSVPAADYEEKITFIPSEQW